MQTPTTFRDSPSMSYGGRPERLCRYWSVTLQRWAEAGAVEQIQITDLAALSEAERTAILRALPRLGGEVAPDLTTENWAALGYTALGGRLLASEVRS